MHELSSGHQLVPFALVALIRPRSNPLILFYKEGGEDGY
jgi:hypothetical protein